VVLMIGVVGYVIVNQIFRFVSSESVFVLFFLVELISQTLLIG